MKQDLNHQLSSSSHKMRLSSKTSDSQLRRKLSRSLGSLPNNVSGHSIVEKKRSDGLSSLPFSFLNKSSTKSELQNFQSEHSFMDSQMYKSSSHPAALLGGLNQCRKENNLVDVTLIAEGQHFQAHRIVLASCSLFFKELFKQTAPIWIRGGGNVIKFVPYRI